MDRDPDFALEFVSGTEDKVDELRKQLDTLKGLIDGFPVKEDSDLAALVGNIRRVASEVEKAIEKYGVADSGQRNRNAFSEVGEFVKYVLDLEDVADKIEKISMKVQDFYQKRARFLLSPQEESQLQN